MELMAEQKYRQTEVGLIPDDWSLVSLKSISKITRLAGYEYSTYWRETADGEIIALRGFNIGKNRIIERDFTTISNELSLQLSRSRLNKDDVIYPCVGTIGNAAVIDEDNKYHIQQNIAKITPNKRKILPLFLAHYLMSFYGLNEIVRFNGSSSQPNILVGSLRNYNVVLPPIEEQTAIATALSDTDALITGLEKLIAKKRNIKQGAMQELLQPKDGWTERRIGDIFSITAGGDLDIRNYSSFQDDTYCYPIYSNSLAEKGLYGYSSIFTDIENTITVTARGQVGKANARNHKYTPIGRVLVLTPTVKLDCNYMAEYINNFMDFATESTGVPQLTAPQICDYWVSIPDYTEQITTANVLSDMDAELAALERKLEKYKDIKQGMMQVLLPGKIRLV